MTIERNITSSGLLSCSRHLQLQRHQLGEPRTQTRYKLVAAHISVGSTSVMASRM